MFSTAIGHCFRQLRSIGKAVCQRPVSILNQHFGLENSLPLRHHGDTVSFPVTNVSDDRDRRVDKSTQAMKKIYLVFAVILENIKSYSKYCLTF